MAEKAKNLVILACTVIVTVISAGGILLACGAITSDVKGNADDIRENRGWIKENRTAIHKNELLQAEINTKLNDIPDIKDDIEKLTDYLMTYDYNKKKDN
jgi:hypothetical protein